MLLVKVLISQLFFKRWALVQSEIWHSSLITESKIIDLVLKNAISICGGRFSCNSWETFIKSHPNNIHRAKPRQHCLGGLVLCLMLSFEVVLPFLVISLHAASSICHSHTKAAPDGLWSANTAAGNLLWIFIWQNEVRKEISSFVLAPGSKFVTHVMAKLWTGWGLKSQCWSLIWQSECGGKSCGIGGNGILGNRIW